VREEPALASLDTRARTLEEVFISVLSVGLFD